ncbi:pyruvate kinase [Deltaproteobacteria bacterium TL4]
MPKTKIICTVGPATNTYDKLKDLYHAGMNIVRLNMSHGDQTSHSRMLELIQKLNQEMPFPVGVMLDTRGPEIRTGDLSQDLFLEEGMSVLVTVTSELVSDLPVIFVNYPGLIQSLKLGDTVILDSGLITLQVLERSEAFLRCRVMDGGLLKSRRHVNLPGIRVNLPSLTEQDKEDILMGVSCGVDFIAMSFVRSVEDVLELKAFLKNHGKMARIIAKIEDQEGVKNLEKIAEEADGIMVARGDLGIEIPIEDIPVIQRRIVETCARLGKFVIIATQLLETMIENPIPTRAEVTDVFHAIMQEVNAVMLSGETSVGRYPVKAVRQLVKIAQNTEKLQRLRLWEQYERSELREHLAAAAVQLADDLKIRAIIILTETGLSAESISNCRPLSARVYAFTQNPSTYRALTLYWGVIPFLIPPYQDRDEAFQSSMELLKTREKFKTGDSVILFSVISAKSTGTIHVCNLL